MIPEEMYGTLDETSLEHWVMELPEDEAGCEHSSGCNQPAEWRSVLPCGCACSFCTPHWEHDHAIAVRYAGDDAECNRCAAPFLLGPAAPRGFRI